MDACTFERPQKYYIYIFVSVLPNYMHILIILSFYCVLMGFQLFKHIEIDMPHWDVEYVLLCFICRDAHNNSITIWYIGK